MKPAKLYTVEVTEEGEDLVIEFPEVIVQEQGWIVGDKLEWIIHNDYVILRKAPNEVSDTE